MKGAQAAGPPATAQRVTLADVAARAGVSRSTASLAFSGAGPVASDTRARVLAAAGELGYAGPDPLARSLRQRRSGVVGVVTGQRLLHVFRDQVTIALLDGMAEELTALSSSLLLLPEPDSQPGRLSQVPLDALVFATCGSDDDPLLDEAIARRVPTVGVEGPRRPGVPLVDVAQREGSRAAAHHLVELGHRHLAVITLPLCRDGTGGSASPQRQARASFAVARERLAGVRDEVGEDLAVVETPVHLVEAGEEAAAALLRAADPPTAIVAQSDLLAVGAIRAARRAGLDVPTELSVIGFDGIDTAGWLGGELRLTTVEQPMVEKGHVAGRMVAALLDGRVPADVTLPVTLRAGDTTAPPAR